ncbi:hypothetical protein [Streptomyces sp. NPDC059215]|uniref:hypothetical protein n=1 Tax=Streptomyces sp. NPDC059215 TaxID=3346772 RepID=UPI0036C7EAA7
MHFAAQAQVPLVVEVLLAAGAAVDTSGRHVKRPLLRAVFCSQGEGATIRLCWRPVPTLTETTAMA